VVAADKHESARRINVLIGVIYAATAAVGFLGVLDFLAIPNAGSADNWLHLATAALSVYFGTAGATLGYRTSTV
jgi:hypothetical protein